MLASICCCFLASPMVLLRRRQTETCSQRNKKRILQPWVTNLQSILATSRVDYSLAVLNWEDGCLNYLGILEWTPLRLLLPQQPCLPHPPTHHQALYQNQQGISYCCHPHQQQLYRKQLTISSHFCRKKAPLLQYWRQSLPLSLSLYDPHYSFC